MNTQPQKVPFGYEPPIDREKGTLIYYDTFEQTTEEELDLALEAAVARSFAKFVLYPIHEETAKRMSKEPVSPYYKREKLLREWEPERGRIAIAIDGWEGKRKKYTPIDSALRHLTETLPAPHFLLVTPQTANQFASFASFEEWIVKIRLLMSSEPSRLHPRLEQNRHRWDLMERSD
ncbi:hypothetical protein [Cohnella herbarum]|uniref:Uncharacterized protein n=1 Tax=Cohnella herbarum TaxID=2728023 RepID=A0A7Z2VRQ6_9BACL|nr:hypothetical protein [Cohnella herbarum]QJD87944.1 hypothetical protein HH215_02250 [Cohnella herbarum]